MGVVIFNGKSSQDYQLLIEIPPSYTFPERDYEVVHVPGRNGDIVRDNGSYKNVDRSYYIASGSYDEDFPVLANRISEWLHSASGYARLEDSYEPEFYRMAMYDEGGTIQNIYRHAGRIAVNFNCKPQRYLKSGDRPVSVYSAGITLRNPTFFTALPVFIVHGDGRGVLKAGDHTVTFRDVAGTTIIDSETQDAWFENENRNNNIELSANGFPKLYPGDNEIRFTGEIRAVEVIPKWWTL